MITQFSYLRLPVSDLYYSIRTLPTQSISPGITCYTQQYAYPSDIKKFTHASGKFLMLNGFMECDMNEDKALNRNVFGNRIDFKIVIPEKPKTKVSHQGFAIVNQVFP